MTAAAGEVGESLELVVAATSEIEDDDAVLLMVSGSAEEEIPDVSPVTVSYTTEHTGSASVEGASVCSEVRAITEEVAEAKAEAGAVEEFGPVDHPLKEKVWLASRDIQMAWSRTLADVTAKQVPA